MKDYGKQCGSVSPKLLEITATSVFLASNITKQLRESDGHSYEVYEYNLVEYTKDEYIAKLSEDNAELQQQVLDTQLALCDIYENIGTGGDI